MNVELLKPLKEENKSWTLASDEKLLNYLKIFSKEITKSTQICTENMNELHNSLYETETSLRNTFNEFIMLGNSQFIENVRYRVIYIYVYICIYIIISFMNVGVLLLIQI